jgi:hypothetical protein
MINGTKNWDLTWLLLEHEAKVITVSQHIIAFI